MNIRFKKIGLENFLSFGDYQEVDLEDRGYTLINGINNNPADNSQSNGAGKTSLIDAIMYALTGNTTRGINKDLTNKYTEGGMMVKLDFDVDNTQYTIIRSKDHHQYGSTILFYVNGENKSGKGVTDTKKIIKEYLPDLTEDLITSVIILGQGMPDRFTNNTPAGRKEVLETLSHSDFMIADIKEKISNRKTALAGEINSLKNEQSKLEGQINVYNEQVRKNTERLNSLVPVDKKEVDDATDVLNSLNEKLESYTSKQTDINNQINSLTSEINLYKDKKLDLLNNLNNQYSATLQFYRDEQTQTKAKMDSLEREINRVKSNTGICPTCGRPLEGFHRIDTTDMEAEVEDLKGKYNVAFNNYNASSSEFTNKKNEVEREQDSKINEINRNIVSLRNNDLAEVNRQISDCKFKIKSQEKIVSDLSYNYNNYQRLVEELNNNIIEANGNIEKFQSQIVYNKEKNDELDARADIVNKINTIATRDFRGYLLTNVIEYLNSQAKIYSSDIFGNSNVEFQLDGNNLDVIYNDKLYENLSGGEKKKVDIICQLAIRDMLCQYSNFNSNILVLDEFTDSLDKISTEAVVNCIAKRLGNIESVFIITHATNFPIPNDSIITIVKDKNGVSKIQ